MRSQSFAALFGVALFVGAAASAQAADFTAAGPVSLVVSGADNAALGVVYPVTVMATNTTPNPLDAQCWWQ